MKIRANNKAMTQMQGVLIIVILVVVATIGFYYYPRPHSTKKLTIDFWYSGHWPQSEDQALLYKTQLERTGLITVNLHAAEWAAYKKNRAAETMPVYMASWIPDYLDPDN